ncbi:MAG: metallophosphoesterase [Campylobacterales bacterium]|nr:metallophosphoesterase [Campylobacterales bacterium]
MSHKNFSLKEGAYLVCDAHYSNLRPELLGLIEAIHSKTLHPTQLILMGDVFDALFGGVSYTEMQNRKIIRLINEIARFIEVIYLEGNHDFLLKEYFPKIKVFPMQMQPVSFSFGKKKIVLAHGDFNGSWSYRVYSKLIRNRKIVRVLTLIDTLFGHKILKKLDAYLAQKNDCKEFEDFKRFVESRKLHEYESDVFIEGHYHQNRSFKFEDFTYINLGAFACNQRYFVVKSIQDKELLEERNFL